MMRLMSFLLNGNQRRQQRGKSRRCKRRPAASSGVEQWERPAQHVNTRRRPSWRRGSTRRRGVGPSMASGNYTCSGNWADLPAAPQKNQKSGHGRHDAEALRDWPDGSIQHAECSAYPSRPQTIKIPSRKPKSPRRLTMKAFFCRVPGAGLFIPGKLIEQIAGNADQFPEDKHHFEEIISRARCRALRT